MRLDDPERPKAANGIPMLLWEKRPVTIMPPIIPIPDGYGYKIHLHCCYTFNISRTYIAQAFDLPEWVNSWEFSPEHMMAELGWRWQSIKPTKPELNLSTEDILKWL